MEPEVVYTCVLGAMFASLVGWQLAAETWSWRHRASGAFRKWVTNNPLGARQNGSSTVTVGTALGVVVVLCVNIFVCCFNVSTLNESGQRLGMVAIANLVPLFIGGRSSLWANVLAGVPLPIYHTWHRWLGRFCLAQALAHGLIQLYLASWKCTVGEIMNFSLLGTLVLSSVLYVRRRWYEIFLKLHLLLVLGLNVALWLHIDRGTNLQTACLALASVLWTFDKAFWLTRAIFRNCFGSGLEKEYSIQRLLHSSFSADAVLLKVVLRRPWKVRHGQYVYITVLSMPQLLSAPLQSHPYLVAWSDGDSHRTSKEIFLLVEGRKGFSDALRLYKDTSRIVIDGPYGKSPRLGHFDKVLLIAEGVGIAAHLLAIRHLLRGHEGQTARVRRISLIWILQNKDQEAWVMSFLENLYDSDVRRIFTILIYKNSSIRDSASTVTAHAASVDPIRSRLYRINQALDVEWLVNNEWSAEAGSMVVSLCGGPDLEKRVRIALRSCSHNIQLRTSPFEMDETTTNEKIRYKKTKQDLSKTF